MTDARPEESLDAAGALRQLLRRAGHELRNAQNAAAVNFEVVRSRIEAGKADASSLRPFAENAAKGIEESADIGEAVIALCAAVTSSTSAGGITVRADLDASALIEVKMSAEPAQQLAQRLAMLAERAGFTVEATDTGVIFRVPPEHETNRA